MDWASLVSLGVSLAQSGVKYATATAAQKQALDALAKAQQMIAQGQANFGNIKTPTYNPTDLKSTQLGDTELKGIQGDPQGRLAEQQAYLELKKLSDNGGLSLGDTAALNEIEGNLNRNASGRDAALRNQYAARGQLGGGAQLAMELNQNQQAGERANQQGESVAAQAQARALAAIKEQAGLGRQMSQDDYDKKAAAAKAADLIKERNVANSMQANQQNNQWLNQGFQNDLSKAQGQAGLIPQGVAVQEAIGNVNKNYTLGQGSQINQDIGSIGGAVGGMGGGGGSKNNPSSPGSTSPPPLVNADGSLAGGGSDPNAWEGWNGQRPTSEGVEVKDYDYPHSLNEDDNP